MDREEQIDPERRRQQTIADTIALLEEAFGDMPWMSVATHRRIPRKIMLSVHKQIRYATALGGASLELRTWISEIQVACGNQGESWIRDWPAKGNRVRHVQLLEQIGWDEYRVLWTTPNLRLGE